jgi:hypothetical protein
LSVDVFGIEVFDTQTRRGIISRFAHVFRLPNAAMGRGPVVALEDLIEAFSPRSFPPGKRDSQD